MSIWFKHDAHAHEHPKFIRLRRLAERKADSAEVGWYRVLAAAKRHGEWAFEDEEHLKDAMGKYYSFVDLYRSVGLLDGLVIHNGEEYQGPLTPAERQRMSRERRDASVTSRDTNVTDVTPRVEQSREEQSRQEARDVTSRHDIVDDYYRLTGRFPTDTVREWVDRLANEFGYDQTSIELGRQFIADPNTRTLLGRVENELKAGRHIATKRQAEAEKARLEAEARAKDISPAKAADNQRALKALMADWFSKDAA